MMSNWTSFWMLTAVACFVQIQTIMAFISTEALPVAYKGRIRPLEAAAHIWKDEFAQQEQQALPVAASPLHLFWDTHFQENRLIEPAQNASIAEAVKQMHEAGMSSMQIARQIQSRFPFSHRLRQSGTDLMMLPLQSQEKEWASLRALK